MTFAPWEIADTPHVKAISGTDSVPSGGPHGENNRPCGGCTQRCPRWQSYAVWTPFVHFATIGFFADIAMESEVVKWWPGRELNPRHADFQSAALPAELPGHPECTG